MEAKTEARRRRGEGGFTLVELLIVVAILAVLVAVVLPNFTGLLGSSKTTAADAENVIVQTAVDARMAAESLATYAAGCGHGDRQHDDTRAVPGLHAERDHELLLHCGRLQARSRRSADSCKK